MKFLAVILLVVPAVLGKATLTGAPQTAFFKCNKLSLKDKSLCFNTVLHEVVVKVGNPGTDDDVILEVCSDVDAKQCCKTPALNSIISDDWSKNDDERWGEKYFGKDPKKGDCRDFKFKVKRFLSVTLAKSKDGPLNVTSIELYTRSPKIPKQDSKKAIKELERFKCPTRWLIGGKNPVRMTQECRTGPYRYSAIDKFMVKVGDDGTDDNVRVKVCSDVNDFCCEEKLSHLFTDDWKKNSEQTFTRSDFGKCGDVQYKILKAPKLFAIKDGKDHLKVRSVTMTMKTQDLDNQKNPLTRKSSSLTKYACDSFGFNIDCKNANLCTAAIPNCRVTS